MINSSQRDSSSGASEAAELETPAHKVFNRIMRDGVSRTSQKSNLIATDPTATIELEEFYKAVRSDSDRIKALREKRVKRE